MTSHATDCIPETEVPRARTRGRVGARSAAKAAAPVQEPAVAVPTKPEVKTVQHNSFFGLQRPRPVVKLDENNKAIKNRAGRPQLPNESVLGEFT